MYVVLCRTLFRPGHLPQLVRRDPPQRGEHSILYYTILYYTMI